MPFVRTGRDWISQRAVCAHPLTATNRQKAFLMLQAYMDDSGSHSDSRVCVVGGYFGGVERWREFERGWNPILKRYGIKEFHAKEFCRRTPERTGTGEYKGWDKAKLDEFLDALLSVIQTTDIYPFAVGVLVNEWEKISVHDRKLMCGAGIQNLHNAPHKPIFFVFRWTIPRVGTHCKPGIKVHFVFDDDRQTRAWASYCYGEFKKMVPDAKCFGELTFADSKIAVPLQAADLLVYEARRYCVAANGDVHFPLTKTYARTLRRAKSRDDFWLFDKTRFDDLIRLVARTKEEHEKEK